MEFDLQLDLFKLRRLLEVDNRQLRIYQFERPIPNTVVLEHLPESSRDKILLQNGLRHFFFVNFEFLTVRSFDTNFIAAIRNNPKYSGRIIESDQSG